MITSTQVALFNTAGLVQTALMLFTRPVRSIGGIVAEVTIEERATDELVITEHPVEQGASISDHAFKRPVEVTIKCGWSEAKSGNLSAYGGVYNLLLSWQAALNPFNLYTGKRKFPNMLIAGISVLDNEHTPHALMAEIRCKEVILVSTKTVGPKADGKSENADDQADPSATSDTVDNGTKQLDETTKGPEFSAASPLNPNTNVSPDDINTNTPGPVPTNPVSNSSAFPRDGEPLVGANTEVLVTRTTGNVTVTNSPFFPPPPT